MDREFIVRLANMADVPALESLIPLSVRGLQATHYSPTQMDAAIGPVFGVDRQLIADGTYYIAEHMGVVVAGGGWSRRLAEYGSDRGRVTEEPALDPAQDPARIRAFFVHPAFARRGIGRALLTTCEVAAQATGFRQAVLVATLTGEPLYTQCGYVVIVRYDVELPSGIRLPMVRMTKNLAPNATSTH